jgi:F0F1-type ATP synthase assembly protein I
MDHGSSEPPSPGLRGRDLLGLGGFLVAAVVGGLVLGLLVDHWLGTDPLFSLIGIALGIGARVRAALRD